jgi:hypothetical protein
MQARVHFAACTYFCSQPASPEHLRGTIAMGLLFRVKLSEDLVQRAAHTKELPFDIGMLISMRMAFGKVESANEWVMNQALEHNTHEASVSHIVKTAEAYRTAWILDRVQGNGSIVFGAGKLFEFALFVGALNDGQKMRSNLRPHRSLGVPVMLADLSVSQVWSNT